MKLRSAPYLLISIVFVACHNFAGDVMSEIFAQHRSSLQNSEHPHKPFMILFSATAGMGKTFIAKQLLERFDAVRVSTDELRGIIAYHPDVAPKDREKILQDYLLYFFQNYRQPNKRIILDASIDRRYNLIFPLLEQKGIDCAVIRLSVPKEVAIERIKQRDGAYAHYNLNHLDGWWQDYEQFGELYADSFIFDNADGADLKPVFDFVDKQLSTSEKKEK